MNSWMRFLLLAWRFWNSCMAENFFTFRPLGVMMSGCGGREGERERGNVYISYISENKSNIGKVTKYMK